MSTERIVQVAGDEKRRVEGETPLVVTARGVLFVRPDLSGKSRIETHRLLYSDLATAAVDGRAVELTTTEGTVWRIRMRESADGIERVRQHLNWIGEFRSQVRSCRNDIELAAGAIREHAHAMEWTQAERAYGAARRTLDDFVRTAQAIDPVVTHQLVPEVTEMERELEQAHARLHVERAESALALGRHLIDNEEYDRARETLGEAKHHYERARAHGGEVERGDAFQFGLQRELREDLESLGWAIETVAADPLRQAHEAKIQGQFADDPNEALEYWEEAFCRYGHVLTLASDGNGPNFADDRESVRAEREAAAERIVDLRTDLARREWNAGATRQQRGEDTLALQHCLAAVAHLERTQELADEFELSTAAVAGTDRLKQMREVVTRLRENAPSTTEIDAGNGIKRAD